jgi:hypothetical protein
MYVERDPAAGEWDLAIVHTFDEATDLTWLDVVPTVLDTTYRVRSNRTSTL